MSDFDDFLHEREVASTAFVEGDVGPLLAVSVTSDPATIFPPSGVVVTGAEAVNSGNTVGAQSFSPGSTNHFDIIHSGSSGDLGYWAGVQRSTVVMAESGERVEMNLRVTELFRRQNGVWKLFHRQADLVADPPQQTS